MTIDFSPSEYLPQKLDAVTVHVSANRGKVSQGILQPNPETGGARLAFTFHPGDRKSVELRAQLMMHGKMASEVGLYRWTA